MKLKATLAKATVGIALLLIVGATAYADDELDWNSLDASQQEVLAKFRDEWDSLPPERQERLARGADHWAGMTDEERKADRGAFFLSIHGTLNHLLLGDRVWMGRFTGNPYPVESLDQELYADFSELRSERMITDDRIENWAAGLDDDILRGKLEFSTIVRPAKRIYDLCVCVTHFFNHQTHHRGQLTTLLSQTGRDYGATDLMWLPSVVPKV